MESGKRESGNSYTLTFTDVALKDIYIREKAGNQATIKRIKRILQELETTPFIGIGNPHELSYNYAGRWSRHINKRMSLFMRLTERKKPYASILRGIII